MIENDYIWVEEFVSIIEFKAFVMPGVNVVLYNFEIVYFHCLEFVGLVFLFLTKAWLFSFLACFRLAGLLFFETFLGNVLGLGDSRSIFRLRMSMSGFEGVTT